MPIRYGWPQLSLTPIIWSDGSRLDRVLARVSSRMARALGRNGKHSTRFSEEDFLEAKKIKTATAIIELPREAAFIDHYEAGSASSGDLRKIIANDLARVSPLAAEDAPVLARAGSSAEPVTLLHVRQERLASIETKATKLGLVAVELAGEDQPDTYLPSPGTTRRLLRERRFMVSALVLFLVGLWGLLGALNMQASQVQLQLEADEGLLRAQLLERRTRERDIGALGELAKLDPEVRSPQGRLAQLETLVAATPNPTWWTEIAIQDTVVTLHAQSRNAGETLFGLTQSLPEFDVRFAASVSDTADGQQSFVIKIAGKGEGSE